MIPPWLVKIAEYSQGRGHFPIEIVGDAGLIAVKLSKRKTSRPVVGELGGLSDLPLGPITENDNTTQDKILGYVIENNNKLKIRVPILTKTSEFFVVLDNQSFISFGVNGHMTKQNKESMCTFYNEDFGTESEMIGSIEDTWDLSSDYNKQYECFLTKLGEANFGGHTKSLALLNGVKLLFKTTGEIDWDALHEGLEGYLEYPANTSHIALEVYEMVGKKIVNELMGTESYNQQLLDAGLDVDKVWRYSREMRKDTQILSNLIGLPKDHELNYLIARDVKGADIKKHGDAIIESGHPNYNFVYAENIEGADILKHGEVVIKSKNLRSNYSFPKYIKGAEVLRHGKVIIDSKKKKENYEFARDVKGADIKEHGKVIIDVGTENDNFNYCMSMKARRKYVDLESHLDVMKNIPARKLKMLLEKFDPVYIRWPRTIYRGLDSLYHNLLDF
ncbi:MAG: hypothetical protein GOV00_04610 [Candidatus Altiarchaeota archaeon]|nr:hypothetical protein [Candidatus Altiarchaeota archaeon]